MPFMPFGILGMWLRGLLSLALIGLGIFLVRRGYEEARTPPRPVVVVERDAPRDPDAPRDAGERRVVAWRPGLNRPTAYLAGGAALLAWSALGGLVVLPLLMRLGGGNDPGSKSKASPSP
ncbi:MAG TPA: hypothetical protein VF590_04670, partial [Isosphaeraceae bacterium]